MKLALLALIVWLVAGSSLAVAGKGGRGPEAVEWGTVDWLRDYDQAAREARATGKPIFLLFQEVPG